MDRDLFSKLLQMIKVSYSFKKDALPEELSFIPEATPAGSTQQRRPHIRNLYAYTHSIGGGQSVDTIDDMDTEY